jgi:RNA polymerase sigma-70 factor (ECF subfamily)
MTGQRALAPPGGEPLDPDVISEVLAGNRARFAILVRRHNQAAFRACRAILGNDHDAEDAVQAAWLNAFRALGSFRSDATFRTWITRIAVNEAVARRRARQRLAALPTEQPIMQHDEGPEHSAFTKELARLLEREIDALPEGLRSVLVLRDVIELDSAETATCLGIEVENVRVRLHRARQALAQRLTSTIEDVLGTSTHDLWRFDGERCARVLAGVMAEIE